MIDVDATQMTGTPSREWISTMQDASVVETHHVTGMKRIGDLKPIAGRKSGEVRHCFVATRHIFWGHIGEASNRVERAQRERRP